MLHVNINILHVDINKSHVTIIILHVDIIYLAYKGQTYVYATTAMNIFYTTNYCVHKNYFQFKKMKAQDLPVITVPS